MLLGSAAVALAGLPASAWACSVCGGGPDRSQGAYIIMTIIMSALPLAMAAGIVTWLVVSVRAAARREANPEVQPLTHPKSP